MFKFLKDAFFTVTLFSLGSAQVLHLFGIVASVSLNPSHVLFSPFLHAIDLSEQLGHLPCIVAHIQNLADCSLMGLLCHVLLFLECLC